MSAKSETKQCVKLMGKKLGMTQQFDEKGHSIVCTVIQIEPNAVIQVKTNEKDGYTAIQTGFEKIKANNKRTLERRVTKPMLGHFEKANVIPRRHLIESRIENVDGYEVGQEFGAEMFKECKFVDVIATSIGKGYQGAMKLHNFSGMKASHGTGPVHRHLGSTGNRSTPGRCFKGGKRASQMGNRQVSVQNLEIFKIDEEENIILVKGAVPGARNGIVTLQQAKKKVGS